MGYTTEKPAQKALFPTIMMNSMDVGWTWVHSKTGDFTAQSAFDFLFGPQTSVVDKQLLEPCWMVQQRRD
ncbi:hypothetical protein Ancab_019390, partial [Ancistrocladus abbreviatus]